MTVIEEFEKNIIELSESLKKILGNDTDKFVQISINYIKENRKLLEKNKISLYASITKAAQQGVYIDGQESALVPFKGDVKLMIMYKGLLKQVRNSGELESLNCAVCYENDVFEYYVDENGEHLKHVPSFTSSDRGKPKLTYCIARIKSGSSPYIEIMTEEDVQCCKKSSKAGSDSPWNGAFADEMRKKTVIRRISKRLPMSTDLQASLHLDDELFIPKEEDSLKEEKTTSNKLSEAIKKSNEPVTDPVKNVIDAEPVKNVLDEEPKIKGEYIEGIITETIIKDVTKDGEPVKRYECKVNGEWLGSFSEKAFEEMQQRKNSGEMVWVLYETILNKRGLERKNFLGTKDAPKVSAQPEVYI